MAAILTHEAFSEQLNTKFQIQLDENTSLELELIEVSELKLYPQQEEFTIVFRGPANAFLSQGTGDFRHERMGKFELFIVPVRQDEQGFYYEAVFNRLREQ
jgi:uncharacterized protein DUF6916